MTNQNGILYFNAGTKLLPRLLVSLYTLQKFNNQHISIISIYDKISYKYCKLISEYFQIPIILIDQTLFIKHYYWFEKSRLHLYTPYENTLFIDSDTIILDNFNELFSLISSKDFIVPQFSNWITSGQRIRSRLSQWKDTNPELVEKTIRSRSPSINVGVFGFNKKSELMHNWFDFTITHPNANLPEETSCHLLLQKYSGSVVSNIYNSSCKFDKPLEIGAKILHYHGRKHCLLDISNKPKYNSELWINNWLHIYKNNICNIQSWYKNCNDRSLNFFMRKIGYE